MSRKTFINVILDESGSMADCRGATVSGFNEYLADQQTKAKENGDTVLFSLTKFNTDCHIAHLAVPIEDIPALSDKTYTPGGMTALFDAIGRTLKNLEEDLKRESEQPAVLVVIITDGQENSSKEYSQKTIVSLIEEKKKGGNFTFVFLGADIDVWQGQTLGIDAGNMIKYGKGQSVAAFKAMSVGTSNYLDNARSGNLNYDKFVSDAAGAWDAAVQADDAEAACDDLVGNFGVDDVEQPNA